MTNSAIDLLKYAVSCGRSVDPETLKEFVNDVAVELTEAHARDRLQQVELTRLRQENLVLGGLALSNAQAALERAVEELNVDQLSTPPPHELERPDLEELDLNELIESGILLEANRRFFHPLGLALSVEGDRLYIADDRSDLEGWIFTDLNQPDAVEKFNNVARIEGSRFASRWDAVGYWVQPGPDRNGESPQLGGEPISGAPNVGASGKNVTVMDKPDLRFPGGKTRVRPGRIFGCSVITGFEFGDYIECSELAWRVWRNVGVSANYCHEHLMELEGIDLPLDF